MWLKKNWKALLFVIGLLLSLAGVFVFWILSESDSVSATWQRILPWFSGASGALFIGLIYWLNGARKKW